MSTISMNNVAGFKSDLNTANEAATQSLQTPEKPVNNLGFIPKTTLRRISIMPRAAGSK
ncbi:hypothetical protein VRB21_16070 [Pseudomonas poae]